MKNSKIQIFSLILFFLSTSVISFCQKGSRSPISVVKRATKFKLNNERLIRIDLLTNPQMLANSQATLSLQIQSEAISQHLSLCASGSYFARTRSLLGYDYQMDDRTVGAELRFYPFKVQNIDNQITRRQPKFCNGRYSCADKRKGISTDFLRGIYLAPGYLFQKTNFNYVVSSEEQTPINQFSFELLSHKATFYVGYLFRVSHFTFGASYGWMFGQPKWEGPLDIFGKQYLTNTFPFEYRLEQGFRLEAGIHF